VRQFWEKCALWDANEEPKVEDPVYDPNHYWSRISDGLNDIPH
jgi:hypothetical protein